MAGIKMACVVSASFAASCFRIATARVCLCVRVCECVCVCVCVRVGLWVSGRACGVRVFWYARPCVRAGGCACSRSTLFIDAPFCYLASVVARGSFPTGALAGF